MGKQVVEDRNSRGEHQPVISPTLEITSRGSSRIITVRIAVIIVASDPRVDQNRIITRLLDHYEKREKKNSADDEERITSLIFAEIEGAPRRFSRCSY